MNHSYVVQRWELTVVNPEVASIDRRYAGDSHERLAEAELAAAARRAEVARADRDELIRNAVAAGMSICEVELTTGVARWEVRRIAGTAGRNVVRSTDEVAMRSRSTRP